MQPEWFLSALLLLRQPHPRFCLDRNRNFAHEGEINSPRLSAEAHACVPLAFNLSQQRVAHSRGLLEQHVFTACKAAGGALGLMIVDRGASRFGAISRHSSLTFCFMSDCMESGIGELGFSLIRAREPAIVWESPRMSFASIKGFNEKEIRVAFYELRSATHGSEAKAHAPCFFRENDPLCTMIRRTFEVKRNLRVATSQFTSMQNLTLPTELFWMHVPKAGTSFVNAIYHNFCSRVPDHVKDGLHQEDIIKAYPPKMWCDTNFEYRFHSGFDTAYKGSALAFFREPLERVASQYIWCEVHQPWNLRSLTLLEFANQQKGLQTHMVLGRAVDKICIGVEGKKDVHIAEYQMREAIRRIVEDFLFVGVTELWTSSIHLFFMMFGGTPRPSSFGNVRPSSLGAKRAAVAQELHSHDWKDPYDERLVSAVHEVLSQRLRAYNLS